MQLGVRLRWAQEAITRWGTRSLNKQKHPRGDMHPTTHRQNVCIKWNRTATKMHSHQQYHFCNYMMQKKNTFQTIWCVMLEFTLTILRTTFKNTNKNNVQTSTNVHLMDLHWHVCKTPLHHCMNGCKPWHCVSSETCNQRNYKLHLCKLTACCLIMIYQQSRRPMCTCKHQPTNSPDSPDCLPMLLSISVFCFLVFLFPTFYFLVPCDRLSWPMIVFERMLK